MSDAIISWISGPVLRARAEGPFQVNEAVFVGANRILGEAIRLREEEITIQVYEDTSGLRPGDKVRGSGLPLAVPLGPGLLGGIYDGLLRPLVSTDAFVQPGMHAPPARDFAYTPLMKSGDRVAAGQAFGRVALPSGRELTCAVPPDVQGRVVQAEPAGRYREDATLLIVHEPSGSERSLSMRELWPVRRPRPVSERLPPAVPMLTGQRILDGFFPIARGSKAAMPGGFGTGKTILQEALAKWCDADIIIYVGCGERGNEMAGVLHEFPQLEDPRTGRPLMERTVIIANTSNMPVAAREASVYTGVTVGEYFRDQGLHVALMADSTSRWAEALREISGRLGELPSEGGYPAYIASRMAEFYERAARVRTLAGAEGSLTLIGAVSPPAGDFSEPITTHTRRYVRCFWALDRTRAQARFYPAVHPLLSYSQDVADLTHWWEAQNNPQYSTMRRRFLALLEQQARLERMARIVGKDALPPRQQLVLLIADLINEGILRQSAFSLADRYTSPARLTEMMRLLNHFADLAEAAIGRGVPVDRIAALPVLRRLRRMGEEIREGELARFGELAGELESNFNALGAEVARVG